MRRPRVLMQVARWSAGACHRCDELILQGSEIVREPAGWSHLTCWRGRVQRA